MKKLLGALAICLLFVSGAAQAAGTSLYLGAGLGDSTLERAGGSDLSLGTLSVKLGIRFGSFFSIEGDVGVMSDDSSSLASEPVVSYQALFARLGYTFDRTNVYVLGGQSRVEVDRDLVFNADGLGSEVEVVNVFGLGVSLFGNERTAINFEFRTFDGGSLTTAHIGVRHEFGGFR